jgi:hypothetical protein
MDTASTRFSRYVALVALLFAGTAKAQFNAANGWPSENYPYAGWQQASSVCVAVWERCVAAGKDVSRDGGEYLHNYDDMYFWFYRGFIVNELAEDASLYHLNTLVASRYSAYLQYELLRLNKAIIRNVYTSFADTSKLESGTFTAYLQSRVGSYDDSIPKWTNSAELLTFSGAPTNYLDVTLPYELNASESGWKYMPHVLSNLIITVDSSPWKTSCVARAEETLEYSASCSSTSLTTLVTGTWAEVEGWLVGPYTHYAPSVSYSGGGASCESTNAAAPYFLVSVDPSSIAGGESMTYEANYPDACQWLTNYPDYTVWTATYSASCYLDYSGSYLIRNSGGGSVAATNLNRSTELYLKPSVDTSDANAGTWFIKGKSAANNSATDVVAIVSIYDAALDKTASSVGTADNNAAFAAYGNCGDELVWETNSYSSAQHGDDMWYGTGECGGMDADPEGPIPDVHQTVQTVTYIWVGDTNSGSWVLNTDATVTNAVFPRGYDPDACIWLIRNTKDTNTFVAAIESDYEITGSSEVEIPFDTKTVTVTNETTWCWYHYISSSGVDLDELCKASEGDYSVLVEEWVEHPFGNQGARAGVGMSGGLATNIAGSITGESAVWWNVSGGFKFIGPE